MSLCLISYALCHEDIWGSGGIDPPFVISAVDTGEWWASRSGRFIPGKSASVPATQEVWWAPESVWTLWTREKSCTAGNQTRARRIFFFSSRRGKKGSTECRDIVTMECSRQQLHTVHLQFTEGSTVKKPRGWEVVSWRIFTKFVFPQNATPDRQIVRAIKSPSVHFNWLVKFCNKRGVKLTTHLHLLPRSRIGGSIHPLPHTSSWHSAHFSTIPIRCPSDKGKR
jgi:hypothetical protein